MRRASTKPRPAVGEEGGFTVIEVLVAVLVLTVGMITLLGAFDPARRLGTQAELRQAASAAAEQELQRVQSLPWAKIALTTEPTTNAAQHVSAGPCAQTTGPTTLHCYRWDWTGTAPAEGVVVDATNGDTTANPNTWQTTVSTTNTTVRLSVSATRYITWATDQECSAVGCGGSGDYKRVTVVVTINGLRDPVELTSLVTNPAAGTSGSIDPLTDPSTTCLDGSTSVPCIG